MRFFARFSPVRAIRDLRQFLAQREPHELWFLIAAMAITGFFVYAFAKDSDIPPVYRPNIIYVQQWRADRSEAEILAQQKVDEAARQKRVAEEQRELQRNRAEFQRLDESLNRLGI